jgi:opacity protein-like surface antigen
MSARYSFATLLCLFIIGFLTVLPAQGEWYVVGQTGVAMPGSLSNVTVSSPTLAGGVSEARVADLDLEKGQPFYGGKVGIFFPKREWFGLETEAYTTRLIIKQQTVVGGVPGRVFAETMPGSSIHLTTWAMNAIVRSPSLVVELEPYGGIGPALFFATQGETQISLGINLIAGARYFVTPQMALFGEFKYNRAMIRSEGVEGDYSSQLFAFGITMHFDRLVSSSNSGNP